MNPLRKTAAPVPASADPTKLAENIWASLQPALACYNTSFSCLTVHTASGMRQCSQVGNALALRPRLSVVGPAPSLQSAVQKLADTYGQQLTLAVQTAPGAPYLFFHST